MKKESSYDQDSEILENSEMLPEYDFSKGVRGKHYLPNLSDQPIVVRVKDESGDKYITTRVIELEAIITPDGKLIAQLPPDIIPGKHRVILRIEQPAHSLIE